MFNRLNISSFERDSAIDWFFVDLSGFLHTTIVLLFVIVVIASLIINGAGFSVETKEVILPAAIVSGVAAFVIVFCFRRNPTVVNGRREFRYICRWL